MAVPVVEAEVARLRAEIAAEDAKLERLGNEVAELEKKAALSQILVF